MLRVTYMRCTGTRGGHNQHTGTRKYKDRCGQSHDRCEKHDTLLTATYFRYIKGEDSPLVDWTSGSHRYHRGVLLNPSPSSLTRRPTRRRLNKIRSTPAVRETRHTELNNGEYFTREITDLPALVAAHAATRTLRDAEACAKTK